MDFLDPQKVHRQHLMLYLGYALIGVAVIIATLVLVYQSYGFGINKKGEVIQNGLAFTASTPRGANVYLNGKDTGFTTNKRLVLPAGQYVLQLKKAGYHSWARSFSVEGGSVNRYDYPFLFPLDLTTTTVKKYDQAPAFSTQSPDRRWLLVQTTAINKFDVYDLKNPTQAPIALTFPSSILSVPPAGTAESWQLVEWSNDNKHLLLRHSYGTASEYVLLDRDDVSQSLNLNNQFNVAPTEIRLVNKRYDRYYLYDQANHLLQTASLSATTPVNYLKNVLAYKSYGDDTMLYVTDDLKQDPANTNQVAVKLAVGDQTYTIRKMAAGSPYLLEMASYDGDLYVAAGSGSDNQVAIYKNPVDQIRDQTIGVAVPVATLKIDGASYVSFSANTRFIMTENATNFGVYDVLTGKTYQYNFAARPLDAPQLHATWMDGDRLLYVSGGSLLEFDYDQTNRHTLPAANPAYLPAFTPDYTQLYTLSPQRDDPSRLRVARTWLLTVADR